MKPPESGENVQTPHAARGKEFEPTILEVSCRHNVPPVLKQQFYVSAGHVQ